MEERNKFLSEAGEPKSPEKTAYRDRMKRHRITSFYRVLIGLAVIGLVAAIIAVQYSHHIYEDYEIVKESTREYADGARDITLGDCILTYSKDGAHCTNMSGVVVWNQTYEIQDLLVVTDKNMTAITGYNERVIYIADSEKIYGQITTNMPVKDVAVSAAGIITAVVEEGNVTWINTYNMEGEMLYTGQARMNESGYPLSISLSANGELLAVSYVFLEAGTLKTNLAFYNFGEVGDNYNDYLVNNHSYTNLLVPDVKFINNTTAVAVGDSRVMIYKGSQIPDATAERLFDKEIQATFFGDNHVAMVFLNDSSEERYLLQVYNDKAELVLEYPFEMDFSNIILEDDKVILYSENQLEIVTYKGLVKFKQTLDRYFHVVIPANSPYRYYLISEDKIETIQLK